MTIGELAQRAEVPISTLRFYEKRGLLLPQSRSEAGYRHYADKDIVRARFIKRAQQLGFTLKEIEELLALLAHAAVEGTANERRELEARGRAKVAEIDDRLADLSRMKAAMLDLMAEECVDPSRPCPVMAALAPP